MNKKIAVTILIFSLIYVFSACNSTSSNEDISKKGANTENTAFKNGQTVYKTYCLACHGKNGNAKLAGAKDLTASRLSETEIKTIIAEGSKNKKMLAYGKILKKTDLEAVTAYVKSLQK
ncbi:MAG: c-type cytochrome [Chitinophagales bacterium]